MHGLEDILAPDVLESALFQEALTHRSARKRNNERLEYLGDAVLGMVIADYLFHQKPDADEGQLSRLRSHLVRKETLAELAVELNLGSHLRLGAGELKSGGFRRDTILADAMEAIVAAVYLLNGMQAARDFLLGLYRSRLASLPDGDDVKDPKTRLQEYLQSRNLALPVYCLQDVEGASHAQHFTTECLIDSLDIQVIGQGTSKRRSEQDAASKAIGLLDDC